MANRDLSLTERNEEVRDKQPVTPVVSFSLSDKNWIAEAFFRSVEKRKKFAINFFNLFCAKETFVKDPCGNTI